MEEKKVVVSINYQKVARARTDGAPSCGHFRTAVKVFEMKTSLKEILAWRDNIERRGSTESVQNEMQITLED